MAQHGGNECGGENVDDKSCNLLEEARREVADQNAKIADLLKQLNPRKYDSTKPVYLEFQPLKLFC